MPSHGDDKVQYVDSREQYVMSDTGRGRVNLHSLAYTCLLTCCVIPLTSHGENIDDWKPSAASAPNVTWQAPASWLPVSPGTEVMVPDQPLTLAALTDLALFNNPSTRETWAAARAQAAATGVAASAFFPSIDAQVSLSRSAGGNSTTSQARLAPSISLSYVLFDFNARGAAEDVARYGALAANLTQNRTLQDVVMRVEQAYYEFLGAGQTANAAQETLKTAQASVDAARVRRQAGLATLGDIYQAETALAQAQLGWQRAQGDVNKFRGVLISTVGLKVNAQLQFAAAPAELPVRDVRQTVDQYLAKAQASRPDLAAAEAQVRASRARIDATIAQGRPVIDLTASTGTVYTEDHTNEGSTRNIGLSLRMPLFDGRRNRYAVDQAQAQAEQSAAARDRIARQIELDVWQAYFDLETATVAVDSARTLLRSANQSREVAQARYRSGVGNLLELLTAQAAEGNARVEVIQSELSWYSSLSRLNNSIGTFSSNPGS